MFEDEAAGAAAVSLCAAASEEEEDGFCPPAAAAVTGCSSSSSSLPDGAFAPHAVASGPIVRDSSLYGDPICREIVEFVADSKRGICSPRSGLRIHPSGQGGEGRGDEVDAAMA